MSTAVDSNAAVPSLAEDVLREGIEQSLRAHLCENAVFLAELLCVAYPSATSSNLLARAHLQAGDLTRAANALRPPSTPGNRYLYALCCYRIGTKEALRDAEEYLRAPHAKSVPGGAAGQYLLASIYHRTSRKEAAVEHYQRAMRANPTMWLAFDGLARLGLGPSKVDTVFSRANDVQARVQLRAQPFATPPPPPPVPTPTIPHSPQTPQPHTSSQQPPHPSPRRRLRGLSSMSRVQSAPSPRFDDLHAQHGYVTPSPVGMRGDIAEESILGTRAPIGRRVARTTTRHVPTNSGVHELQAKLFSTPTASSEATGETPRKRNTLRRKAPIPASSVSDTSGAQDEAGGSNGQIQTAETMDVIRKLGKAFTATTRYQCDLALSLLDDLPTPHGDSALAHSLRARAHLESGRFKAATDWYARAIAADSNALTLVAGRYSTALWHTKDGVILASLAAQALKQTPVPAGAWVAAGNSASLQHDYDRALSLFRRAVRTAPRDANAHTLVGHELASKEDYDGALRAFRAALAVDERCYPALYGIAQVLHKQEQYLLAVRHYRAALAIHPRNAFLHYHLALTFAASAAHERTRGNGAPAANDLLPALEQLDEACRLDAKNPVAAFERAKMLAAVGRTRDARAALVRLRDAMPREAEVHYELARLDRQTGDYASAARCIVLALSFDPKERKYKKEQEALNVAIAQGHTGGD